MKNRNYTLGLVISVGLFVAGFSHVSRVEAQTAVTPTLYCLSGSPCMSPVPTALPVTAMPSTTGLPSGTYPSPTVPSASTSPTINPCTAQTVTVNADQRNHRHKHKKKKKGGIGKLMDLLMQLIIKLCEKAGITLPPSLIDPCASPVVDVTPSASASPTVQITIDPAATTPGVTAVPTTTASTSGTTANVKITFYGSYDNDPKGSLAIAHPVLHQQAGGVGTYADPLTFASPEGAGTYAVGQKIYVPLVQKYFIREDQCAVSSTAPNGCGAVTMVDLYIGNPSSDQSVLTCESALTPSGDSQIIINPAADLTYDATPLWNQSTKVCMTPHK